MSAIIIINLFISLVCFVFFIVIDTDYRAEAVIIARCMGCFLALLLLFSCCLLLSGDYKGLGENNTAVEQDDSSRE